MRHLTLASTLLLAACGSSNNAQPIDAPVAIDGHADAAAHPDAPADAPADAAPDAHNPDGPPLTGTAYHYVVDHELVPTTTQTAIAYGLDLDSNGTIDNQLGMVLSTITSMGLDVQGQLTKEVDNGEVLTLAELQTTDFTNATDAGFTLYTGANPQPPACSGPNDTVCRHHLDGTGSFTVAGPTPYDALLAGPIIAGTLVAGSGEVHMPITFGFTPTPILVPMIGARAKIVGATATSLPSVIVGGGVTTTTLTNTVYPAFASSMNAEIAHDCNALGNPPTCGCTSGSPSVTIVSLFDANHDCAITVDEVMNNSLIHALFAPDLTINGQQALSFGVKLTAVPATYTP